MSYPDFSQQASDHQSLLVVIKPVGSQLRQRTFSKVYDQIVKLTEVPIPGQQRTVHVRYKASYPVENSEWGDFQAHRKVLGVIGVGRCTNENELGDLFCKYDEVKQTYSNTLFDSRLLVFGLNADGSPISHEQGKSLDSPISEMSDKSPINSLNDSSTTSNDSSSTSNGSEKQSKEMPEKEQGDSKDQSDQSDKNHNDKNIPSPLKDFSDPLNAKEVLKPSPTKAPNSPARSPNKSLANKSPAQGTPVQGSTTGSNSSKDANLSHVVFYPSVEECNSLEDKLKDFVASLFWVLESKRLDRSQERLDKLPLLMTPFERKDLVGIDTESRVYKKRCQGRLRKHLADLCLLAGQQAEALLHYQTCIDMLRSASDWLWLGAAFEGSCAASVVVMMPKVEKSSFNRNLSFSVKRGAALNDPKIKAGIGKLANGLDLADSRTKNVSLPSDLVEKYREAVTNYSKFKNAGVIEMEACIKATRVLASQQKYLEASEFLQNIVFISLPLNEEEKIQRFSTLSQLYGLVGMHRKSAFFKRVAAMQCVSPQNANPSWLQCYQLLLQTLDGYKLSLDPKDIPHDQYFGWPLVQLRVLHELIYSARRMGNPAIAVRHLTLLFHVMFDHLSNNEKLEMASVLESYTVKCEGTPFALALDNGIILPPIPLTRIPLIRCLRLQNLAPHLRPVEFRSKERHQEAHHSPFIYSPLILSGSREKKDRSKMEFQWVEGEICDVALQVVNPMPLELKVTNLSLLAEGAEFEAYPTTMSLPAESGPIPVKLHGMAKKPGELNVLGYTICVFGVKSNCRLRILPHIKEDVYTVRVVGSLPQLSLSTSLPKAISFSSLADSASAVTSANANIYAGQDCDCRVTLTNIGKQSIEMVDVTLDSKIQPDLLSKVFQWDSESLKSQLPLPVNGQATFTVHIHGTSDFLPAEQEGPGLSPVSRAKRWFASELADSDIEDDCEVVLLEALLKVQYSGGPGMKDGFCRQCSIALITEIQPSIVFQKWEVLPHENPDYCCLVFDLENTSSNEIEVSYGEPNTTIIEGKQVKRICMNFRRILMPEFADVPLEPRSKYMEGCQITRHDMHSLHVAQFVDIRWTMTCTDNFGVLSTERLRWTEDQLKLIQTVPVTWEIFIEGSICDGQKPIEVATGQTLSVSCNICNKLETSIEDASLQISCFCDLENGARQSHVEDEVVVMGPLQSFSQNIPTNSKCSHEATFVFLHPGQFVLDISCTGYKAQEGRVSDPSRQSQVWSCTPSIQVIVSDANS